MDLSSPENDAMMSQNVRHQLPVTQEQIPEHGLLHYPIIFIKIPYVFLPVPIQHIGKTSSDYTRFFHINFFLFLC